MAGTLPQHQVPGEPDPRLVVAHGEPIQAPIARPEVLSTEAPVVAAQTKLPVEGQPIIDQPGQPTQYTPQVEVTTQIHQAVTEIDTSPVTAAVTPEELMDQLERSTEKGTEAEAGEKVESVITF